MSRRYPDVIENQSKYFLFTFLRDPLQMNISLYFYWLKMKKSLDFSLEEHLINNPNYLSRCLGVTIDNYQQTIDRYNFIGFVDNYQDSLDLLAKSLNKKMFQAPKLNTSPRHKNLDRDVIRVFMSLNQLDYNVFDYAKGNWGSVK